MQAEGTIAGNPFYFRARWDEWAFSVAETEEVDAVDMQSMANAEEFGFVATGTTADSYDASWMDLSEAESIIRKCSVQYLALKSK